MLGDQDPMRGAESGTGRSRYQRAGEPGRAGDGPGSKPGAGESDGQESAPEGWRTRESRGRTGVEARSR